MRGLVFLLALVATCYGNEDQAPGDSEAALLYEKASADLTTKVFREVAQLNPHKSFVTSAASLMQPLAFLSFAAAGDTRNELLAATGLQDDNITKSIFPIVRENHRNVKGIELVEANKIFVNKHYSLNQEFAKVTRDVFATETQGVDMGDGVNAAKEINTWVEDHTNNRIKDLVSPDSLDEDTKAVLVNALYFKGLWKKPFTAALTEERDFYLSKDKTVKVPTMYVESSFLYGESAELDAKLLEIPYKDGEASFLVILPNDKEGLSGLLEKLNQPEALANATGNMYHSEVTVYLPKFNIETKTDLKQVLENIGVKKIFTNEANLSKLLTGEKNIYVSGAVQKAFITVDEQGSEAGAANRVDFVAYSGFVAPTTKFIADHPFVFTIKVGKVTLFSGIYNA